MKLRYYIENDDKLLSFQRGSKAKNEEKKNKN